MDKIYGRWNCYSIISNERYVVAFGDGVTVLARSSLDVVHHFTGIRFIHGGLFVNEDTLLVYTGEQKLFFLQMSEKKIVWACKKPRELESSGDLHCCMIPETETVACIARGKDSSSDSLRSYYLVLADYQKRELSIHYIDGLYRVIDSMTWTTKYGLTVLSHEACSEVGILKYIAVAIDVSGNTQMIQKWESHELLKFCSKDYLISIKKENDVLEAHLWPVNVNSKSNAFESKDCVLLSLPEFEIKSVLGRKNKYLPSIASVNKKLGLLVALTSDWVGLLSISSGETVAEYKIENAFCAEIIDKRLFIGCMPGLLVEDISAF